MASRKPLALLTNSQGELPDGDDLLLYTLGSAGARFSNGSYGVAHYMDGAAYYLLLTAQGQPLSASYTAARPLYVDLSTGLVSLGNGADVLGGASVAGGLTSDISTVANNGGGSGQARRLFSAAGGAADQKASDILTDGTNWLFRLLNDAQTAANAWLEVVRSGYSVVSIALTAAIIRLNGPVVMDTSLAVPDIDMADTGGLAGDWTSYAATVGAGTGTITAGAATVRYKKLGRSVFFNAYVQVTNNGAAGGGLNVSLPFANNAASPVMLITRDLQSLNLVSAYIGTGAASLGINLVSTNGHPVTMNGAASFTFTGVYEAGA